MSELQDRKVRIIGSQIPGCLGRMVNLFDLGTAVGGNKLLTDKPHCDGFSLSRSQSDVAGMLSPPFGDHIKNNKVIVSELRSTTSNKVNGMPMKKLIAQEMSKEVDHKQSPTNVVAKLMGLDALPEERFDRAAQRSNSNDYSRCSSSHLGFPVDQEVHKCQECNKYKDLYEIWQQPQKKSHSRDSSPRKGRRDEITSEQKMALVRQKFMEAKRLVTDEKLHQSREFQDALEVLSSNKDLFIKFLQESNSFFSQHLSDFQPVSLCPEAKRITVLRPSKMVDDENFEVQEMNDNKQIKKLAPVIRGTGWDYSNPGYSSPFASRRIEKRPAQPTRIVVLKPSPGKASDIRAVASSSPSSPRVLHGGYFFEEPEDLESRKSREVAKQITRQMHENLMGHRRDETLLSSIFSNGYIGDDSSFNKSENEYIEGNLSDSEIMSPTSRHSWDCVNRFGSPYSSSSFSRASFSPESSVCREAKKRLSERWALMASNGSFEQQKHVPKTSSTLGEMLALSDIKKPVQSEEEDNNREQEARVSMSCFISNLNKEERQSMTGSPKGLTRSKSLPVSSTANGAMLNVETSVPEATKAQVPKELTESKSTKYSLSGKVSSLFFFRNKKPSKEKSSASQATRESQSAKPKTPATPVASAAQTSDNALLRAQAGVSADCLSHVLHGSMNTYPYEEGLSIAKPLTSGNTSENQDQPSPISVLQPPFEEDDSMASDSSGLVKSGVRGTAVSLKSNLIDKSPPIGSIARTLSWDDSCTDTATTIIEEEEDWHSFIQILLSAANLDGKVQLDSLLARWHSPENPLDPTLRDKYANLNNKEPIHEARRRQQRSKRKLVFDHVNTVLVEITRYGLDKRIIRSSNSDVDCSQSPTLTDYVWTQLKDWFSGEVGCVSGDSREFNSVVAERVVRDDIIGRHWGENSRTEVDNLGKELEGKLLEELVEEAVIDLTSKI